MIGPYFVCWVFASLFACALLCNSSYADSRFARKIAATIVAMLAWPLWLVLGAVGLVCYCLYAFVIEAGQLLAGEELEDD